MKDCHAQFKYLLAVYELLRSSDKARSVDIAKRLEVSRPSVSKTLKRLADNGYVSQDFSNEIALTEKGIKKGRELFENYRYVKLFFKKVIKLSENDADDQALTFLATFPQETVRGLSLAMRETILRQRELRKLSAK